METKAKKIVTELARMAGVTVNGQNSWDITVKDDRFYQKLLKDSLFNFGETYMDGWWDCQAIDELVCHLMKANIEDKVKSQHKLLFDIAIAKIFNLQTKKRSKIVGEQHYDIGNTLFEYMLDKDMSYSCGYWKNAQNLDEAQEHKLDLICRKLELKPGMSVLDIGCGWGAFAKYAATHYGVKVTGVTISKEQAALAKNLCEGLPVNISLQDYRDIKETFDRVVSIGMFEHVGQKNYRTYMKTVYRCLKDTGLFLLHTIGSNKSSVNTNPWIAKYIFPNSMIPSVKQIAHAYEKLFVMEDWHNFGPDYDRTLMAWYDNFKTHWDKIKSSYDERFRRMWDFYLLSCAGAFRARDIQLWQIVLSKGGVPNHYHSIR